MILRPLAALIASVSLGLPFAAHALDLPGPATMSGQEGQALGSYALPTGPFRNSAVSTLNVEGTVDQTAWRIAVPGMTTLQLLAPLRRQLADLGYVTLFECETAQCGGFDFRYGIDVLPEPAMHVDLGDFRFLSARRDGAAGTDYIGLLVSRSAGGGYIQITRIGPSEMISAPVAIGTDTPTAPPPPAAPESPEAPPTDLGSQLIANGHAVLDGLAFASSASTLTNTEVPALAALADWLIANPTARVTLVGHTDASGTLEGNIALSRARAQAVRATLITKFNAPEAQVSAEGVGYLAPRATNQTEEGRQQNRRVEVILTSTQ